MQIVTGSRLHFGLLHVPGSDESSDPALDARARAFGGAGLMIEEPSLQIEARFGSSWSAEGPCAEQVLANAHACRKKLGENECPPLAFQTIKAPVRHAGFGSGTQLGLAVAKLVSQMCGRTEISLQQLSHCVGRARRSAVGTYGFAHGGFIVEAGKPPTGALAPLVFRHNFPRNWPIVIIRHPVDQVVQGAFESKLFSELQNDRFALRSTEALCRILLLGVIPALFEDDYQSFAQSIYEFNRLAGERFSKVQGGPFASRQIASVVDAVRRAGCPAVGQSSWGPAVYAVCCNEEQAARVEAAARQLFPTAEVFSTQASNSGAVLTEN